MLAIQPLEPRPIDILTNWLGGRQNRKVLSPFLNFPDHQLLLPALQIRPSEHGLQFSWNLIPNLSLEVPGGQGLL